MITQIEARTVQGTLLSLSLDDSSMGILVDEVEGLDPVKATIVSSGFASNDGVQYQSSRREARNITIKLSLEPDYLTESVRMLRNRLYGFFMPKSEVSLRFYMEDGLIVDTSGRVESFESSLFVKEPKIDISIICFDPDFISTTPVELSGSTVSSTLDTIIDYEGSVEAGFIFNLNVNRDLLEFTIYNSTPDNVTRTLDIAATLQDGDVLSISTISGNKGVTLTRAGVDSSLLYAMSPQSSWLEFLPGENQFRVYATGLSIPYSITYVPRYGGL